MKRILFAASCLLLILPTNLDASLQKKSTKSQSQLQKDLGAIQRRKNSIRQQLAKAKRESKAVQKDINALDTNLSKLQDQVQSTKASLVKSQSEQRELAKELDTATEKVGVVKEQVRHRIRYMYMHRGESVLSAFVGAKSVGDIASRKLILEAIARKDRSLFNEFRALKTEVEAKKKKQDQVVARIRDLRERQIDYQAHLEIAREDKEDALKNLKQKQNQLHSLLAQLESDEASVYAQIRAFQAARAKRPPGSVPPAFTGRFMKPANGPITSQYGMRNHPILKRRRLHAGIDIGAPSGSPIKAAGDGEVIAAQYSKSYGNMIIIDHGRGITTLYAHASRLHVRAGARVRKGQVIASVGSTGLSSGPHLHFEVRVNGKTVNPLGRI